MYRLIFWLILLALNYAASKVAALASEILCASGPLPSLPDADKMKKNDLSEEIKQFMLLVNANIINYSQKLKYGSNLSRNELIANVRTLRSVLQQHYLRQEEGEAARQEQEVEEAEAAPSSS